jgi:hypothetical protein
MKRHYLTTLIAVSLFICSNELKAQSVATELDQLKLAQVFAGTWQQKAGIDTIIIYEAQQYGKAFVENVYLVIKGVKSFYYADNYGFSSKEGKFRGFILYSSGGYQTWLGSFTAENIFRVDFVRNFNPETITGKVEMVLESPAKMTVIYYNKEDLKTGEERLIKVK